MLKTFRVFARAVNPIGHTIGIAQNVRLLMFRRLLLR